MKFKILFIFTIILLVIPVFAELKPGKLYINDVFIPFSVEEPKEEIPTTNQKDYSKYSDKEVFLISDKNWRDILSLVPLTTWTEGDGTIKKYPTLIYHEEQTGFDADSIIYFMQQYNTEKVTIIGDTPQELDDLLITAQELGVGLIQENIQRINIDNYLSYWKEYEDVVCVEDNYELALMASAYASLINAPLIIDDQPRRARRFDDKNVICVGNLKRNCDESYDLKSLQKKYIEKTNTDKIILVNPNDLGIKVEEEFTPEKSTKIFELYSKTSLAAPILAAGKHEVILSTISTNYQEVDQFIENKINDLNLKPNYLTIIASPNAIDMSYKEIYDWGGNDFLSADVWYYSKLDSDPFLDLAVGRIFGLTISDSSSNIARSLFYEETLKNEDKVLVTGGSKFWSLPTSIAEIYALGNVLSKIGYLTKTVFGKSSSEVKDNFFSEVWKDNFFIIHESHGNYDFAGIMSSQIPYLDNSFVVVESCLTCAFERAALKGQLFCANVIRKGGIGYIGATDSSGYINDVGFMTEIFAQESTIGKAFINAKNSVMVWYWHMNNEDTITEENEMPWYTLLGDPTLKLKTIYTIPKPQLNFVSEDQDKKNYKLTVSAIRIKIPEDIKNLNQYPSQVVPLYFTNVYNIHLKINYEFTSKFSTIPNYAPTTAVTGQGIFNKNYVWLDNSLKDLWITIAIERVTPDAGYFITANDYEFTNYEFNISFYEEEPS